MATIPTSVRELLATGPLVTLATIDEDGSPYLTITLADIDGDEIVCATFFELDQREAPQHAARPACRDLVRREGARRGRTPPVRLDQGARPDHGGWRARGDGPPRAELFGPGAVYPMREVPPGVAIHVSVEQIRGMGPWREA